MTLHLGIFQGIFYFRDSYDIWSMHTDLDERTLFFFFFCAIQQSLWYARMKKKTKNPQPKKPQQTKPKNPPKNRKTNTFLQ